jgi:hypothetical protein
MLVPAGGRPASGGEAAKAGSRDVRSCGRMGVGAGAWV